MEFRHPAGERREHRAIDCEIGCGEQLRKVAVGNQLPLQFERRACVRHGRQPHWYCGFLDGFANGRDERAVIDPDGSGLKPVRLVDPSSREDQRSGGKGHSLGALDHQPGGALQDRVAKAPVDVKAQVAFVAKLLYTGEVTRHGKQVAVYYPWCLAWRSLAFAKAPGLCGGPAFGHWEKPPIPGAM